VTARVPPRDPADFGDLTGRTVVVTGADRGLGFETAAALAAHGAFTVLACRDRTRARRAAERIRDRTPEATVDVLVVDLADLASVADAADRFHAVSDRLDVLVNNAGVMGCPRRLTADGFELQFATNHLGHFALTGRLLDLLLTTPGSRVVTVTSRVHRLARLHLEDLTGGGRYRRYAVYARTKLANLLFTEELARRLEAAGTATLALAAHPGWASTGIVATGPATDRSVAVGRAARLLAQLGRPPAAGAWPILAAATWPGATSGELFGPGRGRRPPVVERPGRRARRGDDARALFEASERLTGVRYDLGAPERRAA